MSWIKKFKKKVPCLRSSCLALFQAVIDYFSSKLFIIFLILVLCKNKAMSASCPQQKFRLSSRFRSPFFSSLGSFSIVFLRAKLRRVRCLVICINSPPTQMIDGTEKPIRSLQTRCAIQRIWLKDICGVYC